MSLNGKKMKITGQKVHYYNICKRLLWFDSKGFKFEHDSDLVKIGELIHEESYLRYRLKNVHIKVENFSAMIDIMKFKSDSDLIFEVKKSKAFEKAHEWQLKFYLFLIKKISKEERKGYLVYPRQFRRKEVILTQSDERKLLEMFKEIEEIENSEKPPKPKLRKACEKCSYFELCVV